VTKKGRVVIAEENSTVPLDIRVWSEATTLRDAGWDVTVLCPATIGAPATQQVSSANVAPEDLEGVTVYRFPLTAAEQGVAGYLAEYLSAFAWLAGLAWRVWRAGPFDIIHFCNPPDIFFPIGLFYRLLGAAVVFDHHDLFPESVLWRYHGLIRRALYAFARLTEFLTFRSANVVISSNESYRHIAIERGDVSADRVVVVRNGPRAIEFVPTAPNPALKRGFAYMVCYAGVMGPEDGVFELIQSVRSVVHDLGRRDILFVLLGDGPAWRQALAQVKTWGLESVVDMPGMIRDRLLLRQYLCTADICVSPEPLTPLNAHSTFIKVGEYMAMGEPVVAYDLEETRYTAGEAAVYVKPGDYQEFARTMVSLLEDPERRRKMGALARQRILDGLGWEQQQQNLFRAYAIALAGKAKPDE
jgi:glycosyltransferase involved in cell wall biosynthesis